MLQVAKRQHITSPAKDSAEEMALDSAPASAMAATIAAAAPSVVRPAAVVVAPQPLAAATAVTTLLPTAQGQVCGMHVVT
jgi:hypothetical protein